MNPLQHEDKKELKKQPHYFLGEIISDSLLQQGLMQQTQQGGKLSYEEIVKRTIEAAKKAKAG